MRRRMSTVAQAGPHSKVVLLRRVESPSGAHRRESVCATCNLRETCLSGGVPGEDLARVEDIVFARRRIKRGEHLFDAGDAFKGVYAIRSGFFKTTLPDSAGHDQVTGFFMGGELLGMDGLGNDRHCNSAIALEDSNVCAMSYALIEEISREIPSLQRRMHSMLSREIVRGHGIMILLGSMAGEVRLATFLLNLSKRYVRLGYSASHFMLRMSREEIGSYLGLKLETVSQIFSKFHQRALVEVQLKQVTIIDIKGLERVLTPGG